MSALQSKGIVHRDLKPQNLLLNHSGSLNPPPSDIKIKIGKPYNLLELVELLNTCTHMLYMRTLNTLYWQLVLMTKINNCF